MYGASEEQIERAGTDSTSANRRKRGPLGGSSSSGMRGAFIGHGIKVPPGKPITAVDYMALVTVTAQKRAGAGKTPTAAQVTAAEEIVKKKLAARGVTVKDGEPTETMRAIKGRLFGNQMSGASDDSGSFWDHVKNVAKAASPILKSAIPGAAVAVPVAMLTSKMVAKGAAESAAKAQTQKTMAEEKAKPQEVKPAESTEATSGIRGGIRGDSKTDFLARATKNRDLAAKATDKATMKKLLAEADYFEKVASSMGADSSKTVPHTVYRAEICRRAKLLCKGGTPTSECMAKAQASVHAEMKKAGVKVVIPGAAPGRATAGPAAKTS